MRNIPDGSLESNIGADSPKRLVDRLLPDLSSEKNRRILGRVGSVMFFTWMAISVKVCSNIESQDKFTIDEAQTRTTDKDETRYRFTYNLPSDAYPARTQEQAAKLAVDGFTKKMDLTYRPESINVLSKKESFVNNDTITIEVDTRNPEQQSRANHEKAKTTSVEAKEQDPGTGIYFIDLKDFDAHFARDLVLKNSIEAFKHLHPYLGFTVVPAVVDQGIPVSYNLLTFPLVK